MPKEDSQVPSIVDLVLEEYDRACNKFGAFCSCHHGYAVIKEELDELWEQIKNNRGGGGEAREECIQIAAMAIRYINDLTTIV